MINSLILAISLAVFLFGFLAFTLYKERRDSEIESERFREFVRAIKAKDAEEYEQVLPTKGDLPQEDKKDELIELDQVDPATLLNNVKN